MKRKDRTDDVTLYHFMEAKKGKTPARMTKRRMRKWMNAHSKMQRLASIRDKDVFVDGQLVTTGWLRKHSNRLIFLQKCVVVEGGLE